MAVYTYDADADVLYILLVDEATAAIERTEELAPNVHVDVDAQGRVVGVELLYPRRHGVELGQIRERYGVDLDVPFTFAA
jgi:uncharacterized protein YuzE